MNYRLFASISVLVIAFLIYSAAFTVDETQQVVVTQFGKVVDEPIFEPGLRFRIPFIQKPTYFPKNLQEWDGDPGQIPTHDKTYIWVDAFARWKITDPILFFQTVTNLYSAVGRLDDIIDPAVRNLITSHRLIEAVRKSNRTLETDEIDLDLDIKENVSDVPFNTTTFQIEIGREEITKQILKQAQPKLDKFGIELVDVKIKRINYVEQVRKSVYNRMIAERKQIAEKYRSEGRGEARKIIGEKERKLKEIESEAYKRAEEIKGEADAEATKLYAEAYSMDPEFYSFFQTLEMYKQALDDKNAMVLSTDSDFLKYLKGFKAAPLKSGITANQ